MTMPELVINDAKSLPDIRSALQRRGFNPKELVENYDEDDSIKDYEVVISYKGEQYKGLSEQSLSHAYRDLLEEIPEDLLMLLAKDLS